MLKERNSIEASINLGLLEGRLREAKKSLAHFHNAVENQVLRLEMISITQQINGIMQDKALHFDKLTFEKATEMQEHLRSILIVLGLYRRRLNPDVLPYLGRVCESINHAKDIVQEVINELTTSAEVEEIKEGVGQEAVDATTV